MVYTALTRQQQKVILLHEADLDRVAEFSSAVCSDTASRLTNLFVPSQPIQVGDSYDYETSFTGDDGRTVRPDFTVETDLGELVLWEHLGMLSDPRYAAKWAAKKDWYPAWCCSAWPPRRSSWSS